MGEFAIKVSPFDGSTAGELWEGEDAGLRKGGCEPILVGGWIYIGRHRDLYSFVVGPIEVSPLTYIGCFPLLVVGWWCKRCLS